MTIRIFSVKKDGSYSEVGADISSLEKGNGAYLILDREPKKIWIYRKPGITRSLAYAAGRAATNLNARFFSSKYKIVNIEHEESEEKLQEIFAGKIEDFGKETIREVMKPVDIKTEKATFQAIEEQERPLVSGEKLIIPKKKVVAKSTVRPKKEMIKAESIASVEHQLPESVYNDILRTIAAHIILEQDLTAIKTLEKPPKEVLKREMIKHLDKLLEQLY